MYIDVYVVNKSLRNLNTATPFSPLSAASVGSVVLAKQTRCIANSTTPQHYVTKHLLSPAPNLMGFGPYVIPSKQRRAHADLISSLALVRVDSPAWLRVGLASSISLHFSSDSFVFSDVVEDPSALARAAAFSRRRRPASEW